MYIRGFCDVFCYVNVICYTDGVLSLGVALYMSLGHVLSFVFLSHLLYHRGGHQCILW